MNWAPYSYEEANDICKKSQSLIGRNFSPGGIAIIQSIAPCPFPQNRKERFINFYFLFNDAEKALAYEYGGPHYDVIVLACAPDGTLLHQNLNTWLYQNSQLQTTLSPAAAILDAANL